MAPKVKTMVVDNLGNQLRVKKKLLEGLKGEVEASINTRNERKTIRLKDQIQRKLDECYSIISEVAEMKMLEAEDSTDVWIFGEEVKKRNLMCSKKV